MWIQWYKRSGRFYKKRHSLRRQKVSRTESESVRFYLGIYYILAPTTFQQKRVLQTQKHALLSYSFRENYTRRYWLKNRYFLDNKLYLDLIRFLRNKKKYIFTLRENTLFYIYVSWAHLLFILRKMIVWNILLSAIRYHVEECI